MTKGSDLLVRALENEGVDRIFGVPGEENLDVVESLRRSGIELNGSVEMGPPGRAAQADHKAHTGPRPVAVGEA